MSIDYSELDREVPMHDWYATQAARAYVQGEKFEEARWQEMLVNGAAAISFEDAEEMGDSDPEFRIYLHESWELSFDQYQKMSVLEQVEYNEYLLQRELGDEEMSHGIMFNDEPEFQFRMPAAQIGATINLEAKQIGMIVSWIKKNKNIDLKQAPFSVEKENGPYKQFWYTGEAIGVIKAHAVEWLTAQIK